MGIACSASLARTMPLICVALLPLLTLQSCTPEATAPKKEPLEVKVETATYSEYKRGASLTGVIRPKTESSLSFRTAGKMTVRNVDVGSHVKQGDILAEIDDTEQQAALKAATATLQASQAVLKEAQASYDRIKRLLGQGIATSMQFDAATESLQQAQQSIQSAEAQRGTALDDLSATKLVAPANGLITTRDGEPGQVVQAAQTVFKLADDEPRDAVFYLPETILTNPPPSGTISLALVTNPDVKAIARVREISPTVDATTGTVEVKLIVADTPPAMTLGSSVIGYAALKPIKGIVLPWTAMSVRDGVEAVWVVDPKSSEVSLRKVDVALYDAQSIVLSSGLHEGELVVTEGAKLLRPGQVVKYSQGVTQ